MEIEEFFAQAVDRLLAGESIDDILVVYPPSARTELRGLLAVVEAAERMATLPVPAPAPLTRVSARLLFAQRAADLRTELAAVQAPVSAPIPAPVTPVTRLEPVNGPSLWQRLRDGWQSLLPPTPLLRLAPLTMVLIVAFLLTATVVVTAQDAVPGDQIYSLKKWMREQRVATAPPELKVDERHLADEAQADDVEKAVEEMQTKAVPTAIEDIDILQFSGVEDGFLRIGGLLVVPGHRTDLTDQNSWQPISIRGELLPGAIVMLRYQIVPNTPDVVEGIALEVMQAPPMPTPAPTPPATPVAGSGCQRVQPENWTRYTVSTGETLRIIAARGTVSSEELRRVNCLTDGTVRAGMTIYVPKSIAMPAGRTLPPVNTIAPTYTPVPTRLPPTTPPTVTPTDSAGASSTEPVTATPDAGDAASATPTAENGDSTATVTPGAAEPPAAPDTPTPAGGTQTPVTTGTPERATPTAAPDSDATPGSAATPEGSETPPTTPTTTGSPMPATSTPSSPPPTSTTAGPTAAESTTPTAITSPTATTATTPVAPPASAATATATIVAPASPSPTQDSQPTATEARTSSSPSQAATATPTVAATPTSAPTTATQPPPTATKAAPTATQPPPPTATQPPPPPPTATQPPPTTAASTTDSDDIP